MKTSDVIRVSELGGWRRSVGEEERRGSDVQTGTQANAFAPRVQDDSEPRVGLKDYLDSLTRYKWYAFFFAIVVFVLGLLFWLSVYSISYSANAAILKKNFQPYVSLLQGTDTSRSRSIEGDMSYMKSEYVYNVARKITMCIANLDEDDIKYYETYLVAEDIGDTKFSKVNPDPEKYLEKELNPDEPEEKDEKEIEKFWMVIDWNTSLPISYKEAMLAVEDFRDAILISSSQARLLIDNFWGDLVTAEERDSIKTLVSDNQAGMLSLITAASDRTKGEISVSSTNLNKNISVFLANLMPSAFIAANNRIAITKNRQELSIFKKLMTNTEMQVIEVQKELVKAGIDREDIAKKGLTEDDVKAFPIGGKDEYYQTKRTLAGKIEQKEIIESLILSNKDKISDLEQKLLILSITVKPLLDRINEEITELEIDATPEHPKLIKQKKIRDIYLEKYNKEYDENQQKLKDGNLIISPKNYTYEAYMTYRDWVSSKSDIEKYKGQLTSVDEQIAAIEKQLVNIKAERGYSKEDEIKIEYELVMEQHRQLSRLMQTANLKATRVPDMYEWSFSASDKKISVKDSKYLLILIGFVAILLGLIFARIVDILDSRIKTDMQVKEISPYPILAHLPMMASGERYITPDAKGSTMHRLAANLFGILGVNLKYSGGKLPDKTIAVTSSLPREGKSFISFNLAAYYAIEGFKSLLLVADLRNPTLEPFPDMALTTKLGFLDYMMQEESDRPIALKECIIGTYIDNLHLLGPGTLKSVNPARVFDQDRFTAFLNELSAEYDTIVIDSPPLMPVVDTSLILKCVKSALMVLNMGRVKKRDFEETIKRLELINAPIVGLVINRDPHAGRRKYYAYYSSGYISGI